MLTRQAESSTAILFLAESDEIRSLYENALRSRTRQLLWFESLEALTRCELAARPQALILDLDIVGHPVDWALQQVRTSLGNVDIIVLSSVDSAQLALQCVKGGCVDFLLKPTSPEELAWSLRKLEQRYEYVRRVTPDQSDAIRIINLISSANTPALVLLYTLDYLKTLFQSASGAWVAESPDKELVSVSCVVPREIAPAKIAFEFPEKRNIRESFIIYSRKKNERKIFFTTQSHGGVFLTGVPRKPNSKTLETARLIVEHSEVCLSNLQKFDEIKQQTFIDDLTGLYNSRYLKFSLANAVNRCKSSLENFSVLFIDVDHFKKINDSHGHLVGSEFLIAISKAIKHAVRNVDLVFRYGGDEFVILLHQTGVTGATEIAERIRKHIERRVFLIHNTRIQTTVTVGLATYPVHAADKDTLLRLADEAMYSAKRLTRNAVHLAGQ